ncbi:hypothetical protein J6590_035217 [Homalodisca vitripennis]|nr:hypothetical protein J6590_035217 [Homalodisca vitripennis]
MSALDRYRYRTGSGDIPSGDARYGSGFSAEARTAGNRNVSARQQESSKRCRKDTRDLSFATARNSATSRAAVPVFLWCVLDQITEHFD